MRVASLIDAILQDDWQPMQEAFTSIALDSGCLDDGLPDRVRIGLIHELCAGLRTCEQSMPDTVCRRFGLPKGAPYAQGAAWLIALQRHSVVERLARFSNAPFLPH